MTVAEYKREWFDAKRAELHAKGLKDAHIAEQMGIKRAYFSQVANGMAVSDQVVDRMCSAFGFRFIQGEQVAAEQTLKDGMMAVPKEMWDEMLLNMRTNTRLLNSALNMLEKLSA